MLLLRCALLAVLVALCASSASRNTYVASKKTFPVLFAQTDKSVEKNTFQFCAPLNTVPVGQKYDAIFSLIFEDMVDELSVDFAYDGPSVVQLPVSGPSEALSFQLHDFDGNNQYGWSDEGFTSSFSGSLFTKDAILKKATLEIHALWEDAERSLTTCEEFFSSPEVKQQFEEDASAGEEEAEHQTANGFTQGGIVIHQTVESVQEGELTGQSDVATQGSAAYPAVFVGTIFFFLSFFVCCCCLGAGIAREEQEDISMSSFTADDDEDVIVNMVQQQSLAEYQAQYMPPQPQPPVISYSAPVHSSSGQVYMRVPVMTPEAYAEFLAAAQRSQM